MDPLKTMNILAVAMPEETMIEMLEKSIDEWKKDPTPKNFSKISINSMLITFKEMHTKAGSNPFEGFMKMNGDIDQIQKLNDMMDRMNGDHLDTSKNQYP